MNLTQEQYLAMYERMVLIRRFEETTVDLFQRGQLVGHLHPSYGQEAIAVGVCFNLRDDDYVMTTHRPHGHYLAKGGDLRKLMAELYGKKTGCCRGKGGTMHIADWQVGIPPATAIVGGGLPIATGMALGATMRGLDRVAVCFFGEGTMNQGVFSESLNLASVWKVPVVFVCENNRYAVSTEITVSSTVEDVSLRVSGYGMPVKTLDGNDVASVYEAAKEAVLRARRGEGPSFLECKTFKYRDTAFSVRLPREQVNEWKRKDPVKRIETRLLDQGVLTQEKASQIQARVEESVREAIEFAESSPDPEPEDALEDLFAVEDV